MVGRPRTVEDADVFKAVAMVASQSGPQGLTLGAIAAELSVTAPALTQRFGSKHSLMVAFAEHEAAAVDKLFERMTRRHAAPLDAVMAALMALTGPIRSKAALANNLAMLSLDLTDPELGRHAAAQSRGVRTNLVALLTDAVATGDLHPTTEPTRLADNLYTIWSGAMITWAIDGKGPLKRWLTEHLDDALQVHRITTND